MPRFGEGWAAARGRRNPHNSSRLSAGGGYRMEKADDGATAKPQAAADTALKQTKPLAA